MSLPVAVFASGSGTNLQALLDHEEEGARYRIEVVVSDRAGAGALERAESAGREAAVIPVADREPGTPADEMLALLERHGVRAIFLAGYLRLVPGPVVKRFQRRILNIHPALLPSFGGKGMYGMHVHRAVLRSGSRVTGPTVHFVDEEYDTGSILVQWPVPVRADDTPESLATRVLRVEHLIYPPAADHLSAALADGRDPGPFDPPGEAFGLTGGGPEGEAADQIVRGFSGA